MLVLKIHITKIKSLPHRHDNQLTMYFAIFFEIIVKAVVQKCVRNF